ncbi:hypothetical protein K2173_025871 [Erythroxylum novogranatense]|uniref:Uncharacterized protein n=1 Tax=Erythroxylum novogranatense TaxID=1862640 RepID=A0AAV8SI08_9ROSI|nr:hypothetical protein K2173_025871 [Erythroxylum novogranatense]
MVLVQSSKLSIPPLLPHATSLLFEPNSLSLALLHSDSSISLFPSFSSSPLPLQPQILIPSPSSSSTFLLLQSHKNPNPTVVFLVAGPHKGGSQVLFRFYILQKSNLFSKAQVVCNQKGLCFDPKFGALVDVNHGVSVRIVGSTNFFVMYSVSSKKLCVFAVKLIGDGDGDVVKLMRCAVVECCVPVSTMSLSYGFLILGEDNGVRIFSLRQLVKGKAKIKNLKLNRNLDLNGKLDTKGIRLPNGVIGNDTRCRLASENDLTVASDGKNEKDCPSVKQRSLKCRQYSVEGGACFVAFQRKEAESLKSTIIKTISIQALSSKKFIILDSNGDLHILSVSIPIGGSNIASNMMQLHHSMSAQKMAVIPDVPSSKTFWISDGFYSVHVMNAPDTDAAVNNTDGDGNQEKLTDISVIGAIFTGEKIQDLVPLAANSILILGKGTLYSYAIS